MKQIVKTERVPAAIGPYSQAVKAGGSFHFRPDCSVPDTNEVAPGGMAEQTERVLQNIRSILDDSGATLQDVIKTTVFLRNMDDFSSMNEVYSKYFHSEPPARTTVEASRLPKDVAIEIEVVAWLG